LAWGRILRWNPDKSLKSFPPCYSQPLLQLCLEISVSSNSCNLLRFFTVPLLKYQKLYVYEFGFCNVETSQLLCMPPSVDP
jgi:hypothetical protein